MLIFTTPEHDLTVRYVSIWAKEIIKFAKSKGYSTKEFAKKHATRIALESYLKKKTPTLIMLNGHGLPDTVFGHDNKPLVKVDDNEAILKSAIIYAVACDSAKELAPASVKAGVVAYIGYEKPFMFTASKASSNNPLKDKRAEPFFISSNQIVVSLLKRRSVRQSVEKSKSSFKGSYKKLVSSESTDEDIIDAKLLYWNMNHQVYVGNGDAVLS